MIIEVYPLGNRRVVACMCRVLALKVLCEIRLDKDDLRSAIESYMKPVKAPSRPPSGKTRAGGSSTRGRPEPASEPAMDIRHQPLGEDDHGVQYWYLDLGPEGHTSLTGNECNLLLLIMLSSLLLLLLLLLSTGYPWLQR